MADTARFWSKVDQSGGLWGCWGWLACRFPSGYGQVWWGGRKERAHRVAFVLMRGPIPAGMQLDHLCRNRLCVNPAHLEPVTQQENIARAVAVRDRCRRGHPLTDESTYRWRGQRDCRICAADRARSKRANAPTKREEKP